MRLGLYIYLLKAHLKTQQIFKPLNTCTLEKRAEMKFSLVVDSCRFYYCVKDFVIQLAIDNYSHVFPI